MKKLFALLTALCLLCMSAAAFAEAADATAQTEKVELDGFTLELYSTEHYTIYEKAVNQVYVIVYPFYVLGDTAQNYSFVWAGDVFEMTVDELKANLSAIEESMRSSFEAEGITLDAFTLDEEPYEATLNGVNCIAMDYTLQLSASGQSVTVYQREIMLGSIGYIITLSAPSPSSLEIVTTSMAQALDF